MSDKKNFKDGLKGTALFGGVGVLNILISILKYVTKIAYFQ